MEEPPSYELELERRGWRKIGPWLRTTPGVVSMVVLALAAVLGWQAQPIYRVLKVWRVERLLAQCAEAERAGDDAAETRLLRKAFTLLPADARTWRALAHYHERRGESAAIVAYQQLLAAKDATLEDAARASRTAALRAPPEPGRKILELAEKMIGARDLPGVMALRARLLGAANSWDAALALAQQAAETPGADAVERLIFANLLLQAADRAPTEQRLPLAQRAVRLLAELATRPDDTAVEALSALISLARQPAAAQLLAGHDVAAWIEAAERHPKASARLRVLAWNLQLIGKRDDAEKFFADFLEKSREVPLAQRLEAARWLNQNARARLSLELSTPQKDVSQDWFLVYLDALAATNGWRRVLDSLQAKTGQAAVMPGALRALFSLRARSELREQVDLEETWRDILIQLQNEPVQTQIYVAQYAEKTGQLKHAATIYRKVLQEGASPASLERSVPREARLVCYTGLIRAMPPTAPAAEIQPLMEELVAEFPELEEARNDAIYLHLLTGQPSDATRRDIAKLLERNPSMLAYRTTAALLELRAGNTAAADKLYAEWKIDWDTAPDRFKVVRAAILAALGQRDEAAALRAKVQPANLRPEEAALLP
jgi:hypothetical protein